LLNRELVFSLLLDFGYPVGKQLQVLGLLPPILEYCTESDAGTSGG